MWTSSGQGVTCVRTVLPARRRSVHRDRPHCADGPHPRDGGPDLRLALVKVGGLVASDGDTIDLLVGRAIMSIAISQPGGAPDVVPPGKPERGETPAA